MMLARQDKPFHARRFYRLAPLVGVLRRGVKDGRRFLSATPFFIGKGVDGIMHKGIILHFLYFQLPLVGHD